MRQLCYIFVLTFAPCWIMAQQVTPEVIASAGQHDSTATAQLSWTLGETVTTTLVTSSNQLTQGFHQTQILITDLPTELEQLDLTVFPNPTAEILHAKWGATGQKIAFSLIDMTGKVLLQKTVDGTDATEFDVSQLSEGNYILKAIHHAANKARNFKVQVIR